MHDTKRHSTVLYSYIAACSPSSGFSDFRAFMVEVEHFILRDWWCYRRWRERYCAYLVLSYYAEVWRGKGEGGERGEGGEGGGEGPTLIMLWRPAVELID